MPNAFVRKLESFQPLEPDDRELLEGMTHRARDVDAGQDLVSEGGHPEDVHLILEGFAVRYKLTTRGQRTIFAYMIAGDFCDPHVALLKRMDHSIRTLRPSRVVRISPGTLAEIAEKRPAIARTLRLCTLVDEATLREWLVNIGQRTAPQRIAHLFCEMHVRMKAVGLTSNGSFEPKFDIRIFDLAIGIRKNEPELKAKLHEWVSANLKNGKLNEIHLKHHGSPLPPEMLKEIWPPACRSPPAAGQRRSARS